MNTLAAAATVLLTLVLAPEQKATDWDVIQPGITTLTELTTKFGSPDEVLAAFPWSEWSATWKKRPVSRNYIFRYTSAASPLLKGPAGLADSVEVSIADRKVISIEWRYGGPSARKAAATVRADGQMNQGPNESVSKAAKDVPGGWLLVEMGQNDSTVRVVLEMK